MTADATGDRRLPPTHTDEGVAAARAIRADHPTVAVIVLDAMVARKSSSPIDDLTGREREVLALIAEGMNNAAIGERLVVAEKS
ncbi:MAG: response regulator transcription factor, partial [Acidimicrobiia bacterium]|nr:response regulator transcription factor [Acidimicrobiia bacterium]